MNQPRCPTWLLVVTIDPKTAAWCGTPIEMGHPDYVLRPLVLGPDAVPVVTDPEQARAAPEVTVLSAMAHGRGDAGEAIAKAFLAAAAGRGEDRRTDYADLVLSSLNEAARRKLEEMMSSGYQYQSEFALKYVAKGPRGREAGRGAGGEAGRGAGGQGAVRARRARSAQPGNP